MAALMPVLLLLSSHAKMVEGLWALQNGSVVAEVLEVLRILLLPADAAAAMLEICPTRPASCNTVELCCCEKAWSHGTVLDSLSGQ